MRWIDPMSGAVKQQEKTCRCCKKAKPVEQFPWRKATTDRPYEGPDSRCYECRRLYQAKLRARHPKRVNPNIIYTPAVLAELRTCIEAGMTLEETAAKMGLPISSVKNARSNHGLPRFRRPPPRNSGLPLIPQIARLVRGGLHYSEVGARIGKSKDAVCGIIHRNRRQFNLELQAYEARQSMGSR